MPQAAAIIAIVQAVGGKRAADQKSKLIKQEGKLAEKEAAQERQAAKAQADSFQRRQSRLLATSRALRAGSGVTSAGSPLLVDEATAAEIELGRLTLLAAGETRARRLKNFANLKKFEEFENRVQGLFGGFSAGANTFLTARSSFGSGQSTTNQGQFAGGTGGGFGSFRAAQDEGLG
jgi:hypothetical protein